VAENKNPNLRMNKAYNPNTPKRIALRNKRWNAYYEKHKTPILKRLYKFNREATEKAIKLDHFIIDKDIKVNAPKYLPYFLRELANSSNHSIKEIKVRIFSKTNQGNISSGKTGQIIRILNKPLYGNNRSFEFSSHSLTLPFENLVRESVFSNLYHNLANPSYYLPLLRDIAQLAWTRLEIYVEDYTLDINENLEITSGYTNSWVANSPNSFAEGGG